MRKQISGFLQFFGLIAASILFTYFLPENLSVLWYITLLLFYYNSKNEPFWLAFFLVISNGIMGFFGSYEATLSVLPGLPAIEIGQFYVLIAFGKALYKKNRYPVFFEKIRLALGVYVLLLVFIGFYLGISGGLNVYFRVFKFTLPLLLFYIVPKFLQKEEDFVRFFSFLFPIVFLSLASQLFDILMGQTITTYLGVGEKEAIEITQISIYRGFYSVQIILISFFAALFFAAKQQKFFSQLYLNLIIFSASAMVVLSATRGWMIGFGITLILYYTIIAQANPKRVALFFIIVLVGFYIGRQIPVIDMQISFSIERFTTVGGIIEGDDEALATQVRTTERGPKVMNKWSESKLLGWGFSDNFWEYSDGHVGNQNILLHSGIFGALLMLIFFLTFHEKLLISAIKGSQRENLVFIIFFIGWFIIHSSSGQHFSFMGMPGKIIMQSTFFSFGAFQYHQAKLKRLESLNK